MKRFVAITSLYPFKCQLVLFGLKFLNLRNYFLHLLFLDEQELRFQIGCPFYEFETLQKKDAQNLSTRLQLLIYFSKLDLIQPLVLVLFQSLFIKIYLLKFYLFDFLWV